MAEVGDAIGTGTMEVVDEDPAMDKEEHVIKGKKTMVMMENLTLSQTLTLELFAVPHEVLNRENEI